VPKYKEAVFQDFSGSKRAKIRDQPSKQAVAGSNPVSRSIDSKSDESPPESGFFVC